jgi:hypothetical protein
MKHSSIRYGSILLALGLVPLSGMAGTWSFTNLTGDDQETGIDPSKTYTHLVDLGPDATGATINGVTFKDKALTGANYSLVGPSNAYPNNTPPSAFTDTGVGDLLSDFQYGSAADGFQTLTLTGLREAHTYRLSFFVAAWGNAAADISASDAPGVTNRVARDGTRIARDLADPENWEATDAGSPAAMIHYEYVAPADGTLVMKLDAVSNADTFHHYGFINELIGIPGDSDGDGMPDIYEKANGLNSAVNDSQLDLDNDGVKNITEYQNGTSANNPDSDGDGLKDGVETNTGTYVNASNTGTSPVNADTDGDGLKDGVETNSGTLVDATNTGTNPLKADTDGDGFSDGFEVQHTTNPNAATSTPESDLLIRTAIEFRFNAASGVSYRIEGSADLVTWATIEATVNGTGAVVTRFYSTENTPIRFYRIQRN